MIGKNRQADENAAWVGRIIHDRYRIERLIARGGMAAVYLATDQQLGRSVALKILTPPLEDDRVAFQERFRLEAQTLASMNHPNIVTVHDFGRTDDGRFFLAMEYIEGPRLSDLLKDGPMDPSHAVSLMLQVCAGLRYAHKRGVVHRDLKPSNLLVQSDADSPEHAERVKVVDFGLVKVMEGDQSLTREGMVLGSPHCMAPEQIQGNASIDHRADIYAIGIILFRALTGAFPFHGATATATMVAHLQQPIPSFVSVAPRLNSPEGLEDIVRRCLAKRPDERYADIRALMDDLHGVLGLSAQQLSLGTSSPRLPALPPPEPVQRRRPAIYLLLAVGGAVFAMLLVVLALLPILWSAAESGSSTDAAPAETPATTPPETSPETPPGAPPETAPAAPPETAPATPAPAKPAEPAAPPATKAPAKATPTKATAKPATEKPAAEKPATEKPAAEKPATEKPATTQPEGYMPLPDDFQ